MSQSNESRDDITLAVVIPTRNRSDLAKNAVLSVLSQTGCAVEVFVSDNSTDERDVHSLKDFCNSLKGGQVKYLRPPKPLPMSKHWDWAVRQALRLSEAEYITILTDRMLFKPGILVEVARIASSYPTHCLVYRWDGILDYLSPVVLQQPIWTGKLFEVSSAHLLDQSSRVSYVWALPRLLNCFVPRRIVELVLHSYSEVFSSVSPDYSFAYICLTLVDSVIYYDKPLLISYATNRSNGTNNTRGLIESKDAADFEAGLEGIRMAIKSPLSRLITPTDAVLNEYYFARSITGNNAIKDVNSDMYLLRNIGDVLAIENGKLKHSLIADFYRSLGVRALKYHLRAKFHLRTRLMNFVRKRKADKSPEEAPLIEKFFDSSERAVEYALHNWRRQSYSLDYIEERTGAFPSINGPVQTINNPVLF